MKIGGKNMIWGLVKRIIEEDYLISEEEALEIIRGNLEELLQGADKLRKVFNGNVVDLCSIINAKCGKCSEDCKFCAQSAHYNTEVSSYPLMEYNEILKMALENEKEGVHRFSLVTSGRGLNDEELNKAVNIYKRLKEDSSISLCASLGIIDEEQLKKLQEVGVNRYHHNLETSREYYSEICSTHSHDERIDTLKAAKRAGLDLCSGGIIGMGETMKDRIDLALQLRDLEVSCIPINILMPVKGTPLEKIKPIKEEDILRTIAIFKFINPKASIRIAGGRAYLNNNGEMAFKAGASATITGNYLTTSGNKIKDDIELIKSIGLSIE